MAHKITQLLRRRPVILDGATGTELQKRGMPAGVCPEVWCLDNPKILGQVHSRYSLSGADIVYTCTFGANRSKLSQYNVKDVVDLNKRLVLLARKSVRDTTLIAGDIGPTGLFVSPFGNLDFEKAVNIFKEQIKGLLLGGVDLLAIETMMDIQEARAALIAAKESTDKFTMVTMSFQDDGCTLSGNNPVSALITLQSLGACAVGLNCSSGPYAMLKFIRKIKPYATVPLVAKPNAGMPELINNKTVFNMGAGQFSRSCRQLVLSGVNFIGGCCGTTEEHILKLSLQVAGLRPKKPVRDTLAALSSARSFVILKKDCPTLIIGEKINPTGKKTLQKELAQENFSEVRRLAKEQEAGGAKLLDVNVGLSGVSEQELMKKVISLLSVASDLPLVIDSSNVEATASALRIYPGRALINSISAEKEKLAKLLPLAKKYGAMSILLPVQGREIPQTFNRRKEIIGNILKRLKEMGYHKDSVIIDGLAMAMSWSSLAAQEALKTIAWCKTTLKCHTVVGLSNISFGLPKRALLNRVFLKLAKRKGLTLAICDPGDNKAAEDKYALNFLLNRDKGGAKFIKHYSKAQIHTKKKLERALPPEESVSRAIIEGNRESIENNVRRALDLGIPPFSLMRKYMIPAIVKVGEFYEKKEYFLPQLIASAEAMSLAVGVISPFLKKQRFNEKKAIVLLATVEGDVHDIGKNIVALLLRNHGFRIIDLGKDVSSANIIQAIKLHRPSIVGLSALMTTTMVNMKEVITLARREGLRCKFMVGGAVLSRDYAQSLGASYAKDGVEAVKVAKELTKVNR